jgi:DNA-binding NarL/FixJ family response regulator
MTVAVRVVLADDHPVVRDGLAALLAAIDGIEVVGFAGSGREAVRAAVTLAPDVLVMDINMPDLDGVAATREIRRSAPGVGVLMLTMLDDEGSVRAALQAGAAGYVLKGDSRQQIVRAIQAVAAGDVILNAGVARQVVDPGIPASTPPPLAQLTVRERQILQQLAGGASSAAIARRLGIAPKTVNNALSTIFGKLGVANRTEAALLAHRAGLTPPNRGL